MNETPRDNASEGQRGPDYTSPHELLAIVNEKDEECGLAPRRLVHELGLLHRAVHVLVTLADGRLVIQQRSAKKDTHPLRWECVGGHVGPGEAYAEAARREVLEELGVALTGLQKVAKLEASAATGWEFIEVFAARTEEALSPNPDEVAAVRVLNWEELSQEVACRPEIFSPVFLETLRTIASPLVVASERRGPTRQG